MSVWSTNQFDGGMNEVVHPALLNPNCAASLVNGDVTDGKIAPVARPVQLDYNDPTHYGHYGSASRSLVKFYERWYWSNNAATQAPYYGGTPENYLGIPYPAYSGTGANVSCSAGSPGSGETGISGDFRYCVTFVNANGWEGAPGSLTEYDTTLTLSSQTGVVTVTWSDSRVAKAKIYRTISHGADFYCIGEVTASGTAFRDTTPDSSAQLMNPLTTQYAYPPPDGGKYLTEYGGVFFLAVGSLLYFSTQGNPHSWPPTQFITFDSTITGIAPEFQGILVFTANRTCRVVGAETPETVSKTLLPAPHGCVNAATIAIMNNAPVWLSYGGICLWDGSSIICASQRILHPPRSGIHYAVVADDRYYLFLSGEAVVFDRKNGDIFYKLAVSCDYAWIDDDAGILYMLIGSSLYQFGAGDPLQVRYSSPLIGGDSRSMKLFRELTVATGAAAVVTVFVDGVRKLQVTTTGGRTRIKLPFGLVGLALQLTIACPGTISGITVNYD